MFFQSIKYCSNCGNNVVFSLIEGEDRKRYYCENCKTVHYTNPKLVVGALVYFEDKILLCKSHRTKERILEFTRRIFGRW